MSNSIISGYLAYSFFPEYQGLRDQLMEILDDEDLRAINRPVPPQWQDWVG